MGWTMHHFAAIVVTLALAVILWRIVRWMSKQSKATTKEAQLPTDKEIAVDKLKSTSDTRSEANVSAQSSITGRRISVDAALMQRSPAEPIGAKKRPEADETSRDILQLELREERKLRERAEDWAEFLVCELEAHIRARIEAERRCQRLARKLSSASPQVLTGNDNKFASRNFKDIGEARQTWQKTCDLQNKQERKRMACELEHDEKEWCQIVDANISFLKTVKANAKQKDTRTTKLHETEEQCLQGNGRKLSTDNSMEDLNTKMIIIVEECASPGEQQKNLERRATDADVEDNDHKSYDDFTKLRMPFQDQQNLKDERIKVFKEISNSNDETNQDDKAEIDKNPLVCTDSLSNIKKTTEKWENLSALNEVLGSTEDLSPSSADPASKKELQDLCSDITQGLVKKNQKLYETSETVENAENQ